MLNLKSLKNTSPKKALLLSFCALISLGQMAPAQAWGWDCLCCIFNRKAVFDQNLLNAVMDNNAAAVATALAAGAYINARTNDGATALVLAAEYGHTAMVTQLLTTGADVNARTNDGATALILAAWRGHTAMVTQLLTTGADVNARNINSDTALISAAWHGHTAIVTQLLAAGADVHVRKNDGATALISATWRGHTEIVTQLLAAGADVNVRKNGATALMFAVKGGHTEIVTQLLAAGADANIRSNSGATALMFAARHEYTAMVTQLLTAGADITAIICEHPQILAQPENLRNTPGILRTLTSGYHKRVVKDFSLPETITLLTNTNLRNIDSAQHKFIIKPGEQILPDIELLATGKDRATNEIGPEILPEEFSILDLAILSCQPELVDHLLMSGLSPELLTQQARDLLAAFPTPDGGARESKGADDHAMTLAEESSEQIAHMIYYADMAYTTEVQNRVRGLPGSYDRTTPLPKLVERYAKATPEIQTWLASQS